MSLYCIPLAVLGLGRPGRLVPERNQYRDTMRNEVEFQSSARPAATSDASNPSSYEVQPATRNTCEI
eukprot:3174311-Amphidinium_carterae.1